MKKTILILSLLLTTFQLQAAKQILNYSSPGRKWAANIDLSEFALSFSRSNSWRRYFRAHHIKSRIVLDGYWFKKKNHIKTMKDIIKNYRRRLILLRSRYTISKITPEYTADAVLLKYTQGSIYSDKTYRQYHILIEKGEFWLDLHLAEVAQNTKIEKIFKQLAASIQIGKHKKYNASELLLYGHHFYYTKNYHYAEPFYKLSLAIDAGANIFNKACYITLLDNYGMTFGIQGKYKKAWKLFKKGSVLYPKYPGFYYNMACVCAETGNAKKAIVYLKKAIALKKNFFWWERMPNYQKDKSFRTLINLPEFPKYKKNTPKKIHQ